MREVTVRINLEMGGAQKAVADLRQVGQTAKQVGRDAASSELFGSPPQYHADARSAMRLAQADKTRIGRDDSIGRVPTARDTQDTFRSAPEDLAKILAMSQSENAMAPARQGMREHVGQVLVPIPPRSAPGAPRQAASARSAQTDQAKSDGGIRQLGGEIKNASMAMLMFASQAEGAMGSTAQSILLNVAMVDNAIHSMKSLGGAVSAIPGVSPMLAKVGGGVAAAKSAGVGMLTKIGGGSLFGGASLATIAALGLSAAGVGIADSMTGGKSSEWIARKLGMVDETDFNASFAERNQLRRAMGYRSSEFAAVQERASAAGVAGTLRELGVANADMIQQSGILGDAALRRSVGGMAAAATQSVETARERAFSLQDRLAVMRGGRRKEMEFDRDVSRFQERAADGSAATIRQGLADLQRQFSSQYKGSTEATMALVEADRARERSLAKQAQLQAQIAEETAKQVPDQEKIDRLIGQAARENENLIRLDMQRVDLLRTQSDQEAQRIQSFISLVDQQRRAAQQTIKSEESRVEGITAALASGDQIANQAMLELAKRIKSGKALTAEDREVARMAPGGLFDEAIRKSDAARGAADPVIQEILREMGVTKKLEEAREIEKFTGEIKAAFEQKFDITVQQDSKAMETILRDEVLPRMIQAQENIQAEFRAQLDALLQQAADARKAGA